MEKLFITWITFQLIIIGVVGVKIHNEMENNTYVCPLETNIFPLLLGAIFPLLFFVVDNQDLETDEYCLLQDTLTK